MEALATGLDTESDGTDTSPLGYEYPVDRVIPQRISVMPILRSGLAMVDGESIISGRGGGKHSEHELRDVRHGSVTAVSAS